MILRTESGPLYYEVTGDGPPLVFVSGWAMSAECWRPAVSLLSQKYRCLIFDSRGIGRSQPATLQAMFTVEDHAEDLHSLMEAAAIFDAVLIGHEMGALVCSLCAYRHPQDMRSPIVVSPRAGVSETAIRKLSLFTPASLALRELASYPFLRNVVGWRFRRAPQPFRDILFNDFAYLSPRAAYETALSITRSDLSNIIEQAVERSGSAPLIVCGEKDKKSVAESRRLFSRLRTSRLATMRDCGFLPMLEYPDQFAKLVDGFAGESSGLKRQSLTRGR